ncbi:hypothetical protein ACHAWX_004782 [Stephanocyclus meneghinianus]
MNFSRLTFALWLCQSTSTAFTTMDRRRLHNSHLSMLQEQKFDAVLTTKRNKNLGYNERTGRFFEVTGSESPSAVKDKSNDVMAARKTTDDASVKELDEVQAIVDIPPMPDDGFYGMNVTGEINGVKMTSSKQTRKRKPYVEEEEDVRVLEPLSNSRNKNNFADRLASSGAVSAAAMATAAVNAAVSMKTLTAPSTDKSYISLDSGSKPATDTDGLPLVYDKDLIEAYWKKERGALNQRWSYFVGKAVPFLTKLVTLFISEGEINERHIPALSRQARMDLQDLGPTFIKAGQMMSVRPDVLPQATLDELTKLQDSVVPFDTEIAVRQIEKELGGPLGQFFTSISEEPVAAASLAQVYLATLNDGKDTRVAVKVQRPQVLSVVSKDLYVLRRAAEVFQGLVERFAPQQKTNYVDLLNEWSIGFYTELDFSNEAKNQQKLRSALIDAGIKGVTVPKVYEELCTRKVLVSQWIDGVKLSDCSPEEIAEITPIAQEAFLTQLFQFGFFHADPVSSVELYLRLLSCNNSIKLLFSLFCKHPGNLLKLNQPTPEGHTVALIDCGLMASIDSTDQDHMISAVIHLANKVSAVFATSA